MRLNEGLEKLGEGVFENSAIENIRLSSALKRIERWTFIWCKNLKCVEVPKGVEYLGNECFRESAVEEITLPSTLKEIGENVFTECKNLKIMWAEDSCALDLKKYVGNTVEVRRK